MAKEHPRGKDYVVAPGIQKAVYRVRDLYATDPFTNEPYNYDVELSFVPQGTTLWPGAVQTIAQGFTGAVSTPEDLAKAFQEQLVAALPQAHVRQAKVTRHGGTDEWGVECEFMA